MVGAQQLIEFLHPYFAIQQRMIGIGAADFFRTDVGQCLAAITRGRQAWREKIEHVVTLAHAPRIGVFGAVKLTDRTGWSDVVIAPGGERQRQRDGQCEQTRSNRKLRGIRHSGDLQGLQRLPRLPESHSRRQISAFCDH